MKGVLAVFSASFSCCQWSLTSRPAPAPNLTRHLVGGGLWGCLSRKVHTRGSFPSMGLGPGVRRFGGWPTLDPHYGVNRWHSRRNPHPNPTLATFRQGGFTDHMPKRSAL